MAPLTRRSAFSGGIRQGFAAAVLAVSAVAGAVLWSLPVLAAGLMALLRYSFGSLFVVGESVAVALLGGGGADVAGTMQRLQDHPFAAALDALPGLVTALAAAGLALRAAGPATLLAVASAGLAWWYGGPLTLLALLPGCVAGMVACVPAKP